MSLLTLQIELVALDAAIRAARRDGRWQVVDLLWCRRTHLAGLIRRAEGA